jgi:hypothetical protein
LTAGLSDRFCEDFMIAHFFNPPRYMRLLEVVASPYTKKESFDKVCQFADVTLGKGRVHCKDTPGFIANRIGVYWLMFGLLEAIRLGISVEEADAVMGRPLGIPKTGVFGLFDLIGIDLMPLIAKSLLDNLPTSDAFVQMYQQPELMKKMIADGYTGRKGKGGFYRVLSQDGKKIKEVIDLSTGQYREQRAKVSLESVAASKAGVRAPLRVATPRPRKSSTQATPPDAPPERLWAAPLSGPPPQARLAVLLSAPPPQARAAVPDPNLGVVAGQTVPAKARPVFYWPPHVRPPQPSRSVRPRLEPHEPASGSTHPSE